jgi:hypothetical protein
MMTHLKMETDKHKDRGDVRTYLQTEKTKKKLLLNGGAQNLPKKVGCQA